MIHVENLKKYYDDFPAVDQISLDIKKGEILGFLGPNGAGKSTTLRILTGFLRPTSGEVRVKEFSASEDILDIKNLVGYLPESAPIYQDMLVFDYLYYIAEIRGITKERRLERLNELAEICGLHGIMHKPVRELSKGMKQRTGLACAMMSDPEILVLDEPTSGLDPNQIVEIRNIIKKISREKTIIISTHILSEAEATCDRIVIINRGKIVADGSTESIRESAGAEDTVDILLVNADFESVEKALASIEGVKRVQRAKDQNGDGKFLKVRVLCSAGCDPREAVYRKIRDTDWIIMEFARQAKSLESIFRELTV